MQCIATGANVVGLVRCKTFLAIAAECSVNRLAAFPTAWLLCWDARWTSIFKQTGETNMTIDELIARLEDYRDEIGGDAEVRLMTQQNWPFENTICGLASGVEINDFDEDDEDGDDDDDATDDSVLYIVEGQQLGYGTKRAWDVAGSN
jgi:hypothetical protein